MRRTVDFEHALPPSAPSMIVSDTDLATLDHPLTLVDGSFDPVHIGHLKYLEAAKAFGHPVLCHVASNGYVQRKHTPLLPLESRAAVIDGLRVVDYTHLEDSLSALGVLRQVKPTIYVKGIDWNGKLPTEYLMTCAQHGTEIRFTDTMLGSSTEFLRQAQDMALAQFEDLVLSQQPPTKPWQPVTDYSLEARREVEGRHPQLIKEVFQPRKVLDYGCGPGHLIRLLEEISDAEVSGYDPHVPAFQEKQSVKPIYDLVIARELLEHVPIRDFVPVIHELCAYSSDRVYGTTRWNPNPQSWVDFTTEFNVDPTHISCGTLQFLRLLFTLQGFRWRADLAEKMDWLNRGRTFVFERAV